MTCKTSKGWSNREILGDGRESPKKWAEREIGIRGQTETKKNRAKKADRELMEAVNNL